MKKGVKIALWTIGAVLIISISLLVALPEFIRDYIQENDIELIGREIEIGDIDLNYLKGILKIKRFDLKESDKETSFVKFDDLEINIQPWHILKKSILIESYQMNGLTINVEQNGHKFNFDDIIAHADSISKSNPEEDSEPSNDPWHITLNNLEIRKSSLAYTSELHPKVVFESIRVRVPFASDTADVMDAIVSLDVSSGGTLDIHNRITVSQAIYDIALKATDLDLAIVKPYVEPFMEIKSMNGKFNSDFYIGGSWENTDILNLGGKMTLEDFEIKDTRDEIFLAANHSEVNIDSIRMDEAYYRIHHIKADGLYGIYELFDDGDNIDNILIIPEDSLGIALDSTEIEDYYIPGFTEDDYANPFALLSYYIRDIAKSYSTSSYKISEISVTNSAFDFYDYTTSDPFRYKLTDVILHADSLNSSEESLTFNTSATLNNTGTFEGYLRTFTQNLQDIDMHYEINGTDLTAFSPYTSDYIDYPIALGDLVYVNDTKIRDGIIVSQNIMDANQFTWGKKVDGNSFYNLPVKLAVSLMRDIDGNIHLDVPVEGDLKDPSFKLGKVIWGVVKNILVKAVSAPFRLIAGIFKMDEEDLKKIDFNLIQFRLDKDHEKQLDDLSKVLENKTDLNIEFKRVTKKYEEIERYAILESKYAYLFGDKNLPEIDEVSDDQILEMREFDVKDSLFNIFVSSKLPEIDQALPIQKKCIQYVGLERATAKTDRVGQMRTEAIRSYLTEQNGLDNERIRFQILEKDSLITHRSNTIFNVGFWVDQ